MDLSQPCYYSFIHYINTEDYTLTYSNMDDAIAIVQRLGRGAILTKVDLNTRVACARCGKWTGMSSASNGKSCSSSLVCFPSAFVRTLRTYCITWMTTSVLASKLPTIPVPHLDTILNTCHDLAIPTTPEKVEGPSTTITFLGMILDTLPMTASNTPHLSPPTSCTKQELLSVISTLSFT
ncbi:uncharacterized protein [Ptychodera flava]|uniref:uncharacterized protein n=1 Tax=Ptychodera flava TaxID=63121 RepID=UPI00396A4062